jgi:hypothetical protein
MVANINEKTGIRYGVASQYAIDPEVLDTLWTTALDKACERLYRERIAELQQEGLSQEEAEEQAELESDSLFCYVEPDGQPFEYEGATVAVTTLGGAPLVYIIESPVIVKARPCSPCVPNAGDLDNLDPEYGIECYGLPDDWKPQV